MFGKIFIDSSDCEYGVIRKTKSTAPKELSDVNVIAEDECGNYFILNAQGSFSGIMKHRIELFLVPHYRSLRRVVLNLNVLLYPKVR